MTAQAGDTTHLKARLRKALRSRRAALSADQRRLAAIQAASHLARSPWLSRARYIAIYLEYGSELSTGPLLDWLWSVGKEVYVPKLGQDTHMRFVRLRPNTPLRRNRFNIAEPAGRCIERGARSLDAVILPLVGFDARGYRLGTGGGYYDRALAFARAFRKPRLIGYAYALQETAAIPAEPWDVRLDAVITEQGVKQWPTG